MQRRREECVSLAVLMAAMTVASGKMLPQTDLELWWADLRSTDGILAYRAMGKLRTASAKAVPFLGEQLRPIAGVPPEQITKLVADLGSEKFPQRDKAQRELQELKDLAEGELQKVLSAAPNLEVRLRIERLLDKLDIIERPDLLQALRAIEVLESIGTPEAQQVLRGLAGGATGAQQTREATASLQRLAKGSK